VAVLKSIIVDSEPWREWLKIPLNFIAKVQEQGEQIRDALTTLIGGTLQQGFAEAGIRGAARGQARLTAD
jgi:hypothetical protein